MNTILLIIIFSYFIGVLFFARYWRRKMKNENEFLLHEGKMAYQIKLDQKESLTQEKRHLEDATFEIFTLYEMTKDITRNLTEEKAFAIFEQNLEAHVKYNECLILDSLSSEVKELRKSPHWMVFPLQDKKQKIGYLAIRGVDEEDKEKVMILCHQFALALRRVYLHEEIEKIAITDSLTELHTRRYAMDRFKEELKRTKTKKWPMSILMIDVDHFKSINDKYGHLTGDQVLRDVGHIIRDSIREIDIAGRYGGEEFCVVLPDTDIKGAQFAAERIRQAAEERIIKAYDTDIKITVSIGASTFPSDGKSLDALIDKADWALYRAKKDGRNRVCVFGLYDA